MAIQIELLELFSQLTHEYSHTRVAVLYDLNQACRYADEIIAMTNEAIVAQGSSAEIGNAELVREVFGIGGSVIDDPVTGAPLIVAGRPKRTFADW